MHNFIPEVPQLSVNVVLVVRFFCVQLAIQVFVNIFRVGIHKKITILVFVDNVHVDLRELYIKTLNSEYYSASR